MIHVLRSAVVPVLMLVAGSVALGSTVSMNAARSGIVAAFECINRNREAILFLEVLQTIRTEPPAEEELRAFLKRAEDALAAEEVDVIGDVTEWREMQSAVWRLHNTGIAEWHYRLWWSDGLFRKDQFRILNTAEWPKNAHLPGWATYVNISRRTFSSIYRWEREDATRTITVWEVPSTPWSDDRLREAIGLEDILALPLLAAVAKSRPKDEADGGVEAVPLEADPTKVNELLGGMMPQVRVVEAVDDASAGLNAVRLRVELSLSTVAPSAPVSLLEVVLRTSEPGYREARVYSVQVGTSDQPKLYRSERSYVDEGIIPAVWTVEDIRVPNKPKHTTVRILGSSRDRISDEASIFLPKEDPHFTMVKVDKSGGRVASSPIRIERVIQPVELPTQSRERASRTLILVLMVLITMAGLLVVLKLRRPRTN